MPMPVSATRSVMVALSVVGCMLQSSVMLPPSGVNLNELDTRLLTILYIFSLSVCKMCCSSGTFTLKLMFRFSASAM